MPRWLVRVLLLVAIVAGSVVVRTVLLAYQQPTITCAEPQSAACSLTTRLAVKDPRFVFGDLPARLIAVDVQPAPAEWAGRPGHGEEEWAAQLTMEGREPVLWVCD